MISSYYEKVHVNLYVIHPLGGVNVQLLYWYIYLYFQSLFFESFIFIAPVSGKTHHFEFHDAYLVYQTVMLDFLILIYKVTGTCI